MSGNNQFAMQGDDGSRNVRDELAQMRDGHKENVQGDSNQFSGDRANDALASSNQFNFQSPNVIQNISDVQEEDEVDWGMTDNARF